MEQKCQTSEIASVCIYCGCAFLSSSRHPQQKCCQRPECRRIQARIRQERCSQRRKKDFPRLTELCQRKHREYVHRKGKLRPSPSPPSLPHHHVTTYALEDYFMGLLQIVTQEHDSAELYRILDRCRTAGRVLRL